MGNLFEYSVIRKVYIISAETNVICLCISALLIVGLLGTPL